MTDAATLPAPVELDLPGFEPAPAPTPAAAPRLELTGVLIADAQVRARPIDGAGHVLPVLCMDVISDTGSGQRLHCEQIYTPATRPQAEAKARSLVKGARVTLRTSLLDMRVTLPHVEHVDLVPAPQEKRA